MRVEINGNGHILNLIIMNLYDFCEKGISQSEEGAFSDVDFPKSTIKKDVVV